MKNEKYQSYLYIFRVISPVCKTEYIKIGKTNYGPLARYATHLTGSPFPLGIYMTFRFTEKKEASHWEGYLHLKMKEYITRGEWFLFNKESKFLLSSLVVEIEENHYDARKDVLPRAIVTPNFEYPRDGNNICVVLHKGKRG